MKFLNKFFLICFSVFFFVAAVSMVSTPVHAEATGLTFEVEEEVLHEGYEGEGPNAGYNKKQSKKITVYYYNILKAVTKVTIDATWYENNHCVEVNTAYREHTSYSSGWNWNFGGAEMGPSFECVGDGDAIYRHSFDHLVTPGSNIPDVDTRIGSYVIYSIFDIYKFHWTAEKW